MRRVNRPPAIRGGCQDCPVREFTICQPLAGDDLQIVQKFKIGDRVLAEGSQLYRPDEGCTELYNVLDGWIALYRLVQSGRKQIIEFALPGHFLGYQPTLDGPMMHGAECITDVSVCVFPRRLFPSLIASNGQLASRLAWLNARDALLAHDHLTNIASRAAQARIAHLLINLIFRVRRHGYMAANEDLEIPLTQNHIADALGLSNVYVSQTLKQLRERRLLVFRNGLLRILNPDRLAEIADSDYRLVV